MKKGEFTKLRNKLREAEERGFIQALDMMKEFTEHQIETEVLNGTGHQSYKRLLAYVCNIVLYKISELRNSI